MGVDVFSGRDGDDPDSAMPGGRSALILRTAAAPAAQDDALAALDRLWCVHDRVPHEVRLHTAIAVAEVVANIIEHGSSPARLVRIEMHAAVGPARVLVTLIDDGDEAPVDIAAIAMPDDLAERGRGLAMAQLVLDCLAYQRNSGFNHWLLTSKAY